MKRLLPLLPLLLLFFLLLSPAAALAGARRGLDLWWGQVFPTLLPSFLCVRLAQGLGLLRLMDRRPRGQLMAVIAFSLVSGAPNGSKLLHGLVEGGSLSARDGARLLPLVNSVSPAFLLSIIASELLKNKALFPPLALAFYGCILCLLVPSLLQKTVGTAAVEDRPAAPFAEALSAAIGRSMLDMLQIGGCILFACTLLSLVQSFVHEETVLAAAAGCLEVSTGASAIAQLALPLRVKVSLLTGSAAFGGLSLALQTVCCYPELRLGSYLLKKLLLGAATAALCYLLFPLFPSVSAAFASRQEVIERSLSLSALLLSSLLSAAFLFLLSLMAAPGRGNHHFSPGE